MRNFILIIILAFMALPAAAQEQSWLTPVEPQYVCMVNNMAFDREQIAVQVDEKTYYGCCAMCKDRLQKDAAIRTATDPVSGNEIDKATAIIGAGSDRAVYYFENQENMLIFASGPMPETHEHMGMMGDGIKMSKKEMKNMHKDMMPFDGTGSLALEGTGVINEIVPEEKKVNVTHGPIQALQWPEMTMDFEVAEGVDLSAFETGDAVRFVIELDENKRYRIVDMHVITADGGHVEHGHAHGHNSYSTHDIEE